jgi:hypothetical protein
MHHTVPALGAGCSASCAGFSLTDLLPLATGHGNSGRMLVIATEQANRAGLAAYRGTCLMCGTADELA